MSKRDPILLLKDILDSSDKIRMYTEELNFDQFFTDFKTRDAVIRNFEIIGEAANRIPESFKNKYPNIEWHYLRGLRNRIVHDYFGIDYEIVWNIIKNDLESLISKVISIIKKLEKE